MTSNNLHFASQKEPIQKDVIRWAIGSPNKLRSSTWRIWGNIKGDIYVAVRSMGSITKASFHRDGRCQVGFTEEYQANAFRRFEIKSRHWERWQLPISPTVRVLQIIIPYTELRQFTDRNNQKITWLPLPPENSVVAMSIFITAKDIGISLPDQPDNIYVVGNIETSIRTAWLIYTHHPIDSALAKIINDEKEKLKQIPDAEKWNPNTRAALWESKEDHDRHVLELACS